MNLRRTLQSIDVDRLIPRSIRAGDAETLRKARIAIYFSIALLAQCAIYIVHYARQGYPTLSVCIAAGALLLLPLPYTLRLQNPLLWAGFQIGTLTLGVLTSTGYYSGGIHSTSMWWMCMVPIVAMLVSGKRLAVVMSAMQLGIVWAFHKADERGYVWPKGPDPRSHPEIIFTDVALLMVTLVALAWLFEKAKERTLSALATHNQELRLVLDSVGQGFLCCDPCGTVIGRQSAVVETWFGALTPGKQIWAYLGSSDQRFRGWLELGWSAIVDDVLPIELLLDQLPKRFTSSGRCFQVEYQPVSSGGTLSMVVIVVTDITAIVEIERAEAEQRELADSLDHALSDRSGFVQFIEEGERLVSQLRPENPELRQVLHTIKGNCGFYGARSVAAASHAIEDRLGDEPLDPADLESLALLWRRFCERLSMVIDTRAGIIEIHQADYAALRNAVRAAASHSVLDRMVAELRYEPVAVALGRGAAQARALARRLHKGEITVEIEACDIRLDPNRWKSLWSACDHAIRNAVDHGLEDATEREARGKSHEGRLRFSARLAADDLVITIEDDGRGVDWARVEQRARVVGLPHQTRADLADALFFEGLSTRDEATQVSGRGIGLNALRQAVLSLGGQIEIDSRPGEGTILSMRFPSAARWSAPPQSEQASVAA